MAIRRFAWILGLIYLAVAVIGFVPPALQAPQPDAPPLRLAILHGDLLGLFPVNVLHTLVHLGIGIWGLAAARRFSQAQLFARLVAILYAVLAAMGLLPMLNTAFGLVPLHGHDVWLHAGTALVSAYFGWFVRPQDTRPTPIG
jgi:hypothetical protein